MAWSMLVKGGFKARESTQLEKCESTHIKILLKIVATTQIINPGGKDFISPGFDWPIFQKMYNPHYKMLGR